MEAEAASKSNRKMKTIAGQLDPPFFEMLMQCHMNDGVFSEEMIGLEMSNLQISIANSVFSIKCGSTAGLLIIGKFAPDRFRLATNQFHRRRLRSRAILVAHNQHLAHASAVKFQMTPMGFIGINLVWH
ncbi:hypothetical protein OIU84_003389, partial [Salix udensis]